MPNDRHSWISLSAAICALLVVAGGQARAEDSKIRAVVELFTSQGCSSCPPADALLKMYIERQDVLALSMPVHYWDYLGWKDTFASPQFSQRQRNYAHTRGDGKVYTPQVIVNGRVHEVGSHGRLIDKAIIAMDRLAPIDLPVAIRSEDATIVIEIGASPTHPAAERCTVWLAAVKKSGDVEIKRGENGGRRLTYYNVVRDFSAVGMWTGKAETFRLDSASVKQSDTDAFAVLVQQGAGGPIVGAAWLEGPTS
ncbi:MAG: DUF1223 domain-containing protein [Alphaproteobacteria bacterium]|nr:DUF1223 domain-containing protein [Alphaproteobacteria bacterium]